MSNLERPRQTFVRIDSLSRGRTMPGAKGYAMGDQDNSGYVSLFACALCITVVIAVLVILKLIGAI